MNPLTKDLKPGMTFVLSSGVTGHERVTTVLIVEARRTGELVEGETFYDLSWLITTKSAEKRWSPIEFRTFRRVSAESYSFSNIWTRVN